MLLPPVLRRCTAAAVVAAAEVNRIEVDAAVRLLRWCPWLFLVLVDLPFLTFLSLGLILLRRRIINDARR